MGRTAWGTERPGLWEPWKVFERESAQAMVGVASGLWWGGRGGGQGLAVAGEARAPHTRASSTWPCPGRGGHRLVETAAVAGRQAALPRAVRGGGAAAGGTSLAAGGPRLQQPDRPLSLWCASRPLGAGTLGLSLASAWTSMAPPARPYFPPRPPPTVGVPRQRSDRRSGFVGGDPCPSAGPWLGPSSPAQPSLWPALHVPGAVLSVGSVWMPHLSLLTWEPEL